MGKLSSILNGSGGNFDNLWNSTAAAGDFGPLPRGEYVCHVSRGELESSRVKNTPTYRLTFAVIDGDHRGRRVWHDCWLTPAALPQTKRDLAKLRITSPQQLEQPLPRGIRCKVTVTVRRDDDGIDRNHVRGFDVIGIDPPEVDPFAPPPGDAAEPTDATDATFAPEPF